MGRILTPVMFWADPQSYRRRPVRPIFPQHYQQRRVDPLENLFFSLYPFIGDDEGCQYETDDKSRQRRVKDERSKVKQQKPWIHITNLKGYEPEDVKVSVSDGSVRIHARQEKKDGENVDLRETRRVIKLPETVDQDKVMSFLTRDSSLVIRAQPRLPINQTESGEKMKLKVQQKDDQEMTQKEGEVGKDVSVNPPNTPSTSKESTEETEAKECGKEQQDDNDKLEPDASNDKPKSSTDNKVFSDGKPVKSDDAEETFKLDDFCKSIIPDEFFILMDTAHGVKDAVQEQDEENKTDARKKTTQTLSSVQEAESNRSISRSSSILSMLADSTQIIDEHDGKKEYQVKINLSDFTDDEISIRTDDNTIFVDAVKNWTDKDGMLQGSQEIHREFRVPGVGQMGEAKALIDASGMMTVTVPMRKESETTERQIKIQHM